MTSSQTGRSLRGAFVAVTSLFFMWGFITVLVDALIPRLKEVFELTFLQAGLVQFAWFAAYGLLSIPGGNLIARIGYQRGILVGLATAGLGCLLFYPAAATRMYPLFLLALFVVAGGITILQVAANPYISVLGPEESASARLNLAQAFNSFGTTLAPVVAASFLLGDQILSSDAIRALSDADRLSYYANEASAVQVPFVMLALAFFALAGVVGAITLPKILGGDSQTTTTYGQVLQNRKLLFGALGIFVYVGAEVALGSYMVNYGLSLDIVEEVKTSGLLGGMAGIAAFIKGMDVSGLDAKGILGALLTFYWGGAMLGRFAGSALMQRIRPFKLLAGAALMAVGLIGLSMLSQGVAALLLVLAVGFFNSIMFPTIFTLAIEDLGEGKPQGSGVLCTAIVGGAFIPPAMGAVVDSAGFGVAFVLPMVCYLYIAWYAGRLVPSMSS
ncbi:MAG TPA: glucose/galactose MFS transporter [Flavobacteriales bacterium]|nr:glucose/galactose MFS transporter [Flavobacteriales bacterium]